MSEIKIFYKDDSAYVAWLKNDGGWVYNDFGGKNGNVNYKKLHKSDCPMLHNVRLNNKKTSVRKICGTDLNELKQHITQEKGPQGIGFSLCDFCMVPKNNSLNNFHTIETQKI